MDKDRRSGWTCQACKNRRLKGNNQNTPIKPPLLEVRSNEPNCSDQQNVTVWTKHSLLQKTNKSNLDGVLDGPLPSTIDDISELLDRKLSSSSSIVCGLRSALRDDLLAIITSKLSAIIDQLKADFTTTTDFLSEEQTDLKMRLGQKEKEVNELQNKSIELQKEIQSLNNRINTIEKISRDNNLEIQGIKESKNENLLLLFKKICEIVQIPLADSDIKNCRRIAKMDQTSNRPRSVLITISSPRLREDLLKAVSKFNKTSKNRLNSGHLGIEGGTENVYISEHLSPECKKLFRDARQVGKTKGFRFVWVRRGLVYVRKEEGMPPIPIKSDECLRKLQ